MSVTSAPPKWTLADDGSVNSDDSGTGFLPNDGDMRDIVDTYNQLMDSCHLSGIPAPEIGFPGFTVIGSQSAGKSSVLESIVGRDFLPRGMETVTQRPLLIHMKPLRHGQVIADDTIVLYIHSTGCLDLTLHDVPGIFRVPKPGQPADVVAMTQNISKKYTEKETTIILAVTAANTEQQDSAAQLLASQVDPKGERTLHVYTKLDVLSSKEETIVAAYLNNQIYKTKYGAVGVVCRDQQDIDDNVKMEACLKKEKETLQKLFPSIAHQHGTPILKKKIHNILMDQLRTRLPHVSSKMEQKINACEQTLEQLGAVDKRPQMSQISEVVQKFSESFTKILSGDKIPKAGEIGLFGGAKVVEIFRKKFAREVCAAVKPEPEPQFMEHVKVAIKNGAGTDPGMFASNKAFQRFLGPEIETLAAPIDHCVYEIDELLKSFIDEVESEMQVEKRHFPLLVEKVIELALSYKTVRYKFTRKQVRTFLKVELSYFTYTNLDLDQYYDRSEKMLTEYYQKELEKPQDDNCGDTMTKFTSEMEPRADGTVLYSRTVDKMQRDAECKVVTMVLASIELTRKLVLDYVPKLIMHHFVKHLKKKFVKHLMNSLARLDEKELEELVAEPHTVKTQRTELERKMEVLSNARERFSRHHGFLEDNY